jgi:hypothetical protein
MTTTPKTPTRIYLVRNTDTGDERLVRAPNVARALAHIVRVSYTCEVASQEQLVALLTGSDPTEVEDALTRDDDAPAASAAPPAPLFEVVFCPPDAYALPKA